MTIRLFAFLLLYASICTAQEKRDIAPQSNEIKINKFVTGTLLTPETETNLPLVILIQGSGPTDRNGNQSFMKNDSFKKLARELAAHGIATFRYDKRILAMGRLGITEQQIRFDDFVTDASSVLDYFENKEQFDKTIVLGHSQGSLVGMLSAKDRADAFISISGAGQPIDSVIVNQIGKQMPGLEISARSAFQEMRKSGSTSSFNPSLASIFKPQLQPFMLSWMEHDPAEVIKELDIPVLIIDGSEDLQVSMDEAKKLLHAKPDAEYVSIEGMNHIFRNIEGDDLENQKSYNEANRPLHPELVPTLVNFIKGLQ